MSADNGHSVPSAFWAGTYAAAKSCSMMISQHLQMWCIWVSEEKFYLDEHISASLLLISSTIIVNITMFWIQIFHNIYWIVWPMNIAFSVRSLFGEVAIHCMVRDPGPYDLLFWQPAMAILWSKAKPLSFFYVHLHAIHHPLSFYHSWQQKLMAARVHLAIKITSMLLCYHTISLNSILFTFDPSISYTRRAVPPSL